MSYFQNVGRRSKYGNHKQMTPDGQFDSYAEYDRWCELKYLQKAGLISDLKRQVKYELVPPQKDKHGKAVRAVTYDADFVYKDNTNDQIVVEDVKSPATANDKTYKLKKKLMLYVHGIEISEILNTR